MKRSSLILGGICLIGTLYHSAFFSLNDVLKVADSFAYLQMSYFLQIFSQEGLGNGWFGFVYSIPIAFFNFFIGNDFLSAKIINLVLFNISAILLWKISKKILSDNFSYLAIILFFLSPTLLHFNIHVLSENIYIPLFLALFLLTLDFTKNIQSQKKSLLFKQSIYMACLIGLMYLTRAEAFIYIGSIGLIAFSLLYKKYLSFQKFLVLGSIFLVSFFIFISPYLIHLHSLTGEWGLTNKGASNLRQAELRGQEKMDDDGFEKAVAQLTENKHHLIAGFAGGMPYDKPSIKGSLGEYISKDPIAFLSRASKNQKKLFTKNFPEIFLGKSPDLFFGEDKRFGNNYIFFIWVTLPLIILIYGIYCIYKKQKYFFYINIAFFIPAFIFFTLFFTLNRYFLIFLPLLLICFCYGIESITWNKKYLQVFFIGNFISTILLSTLVYYNTESPKDEYYKLKQEAGIWLQNNSTTDLKLMERFPIVTYYSGSKTRYITPYTSDIKDIKEYGNYHNIDILVVDTMDFKTYRSKLTQYLEFTPSGFIKLKEFSNEQNQKVILYKLEK